jgi:hypothetical protein
MNRGFADCRARVLGNPVRGLFAPHVPAFLRRLGWWQLISAAPFHLDRFAADIARDAHQARASLCHHLISRERVEFIAFPIPFGPTGPGSVKRTAWTFGERLPIRTPLRVNGSSNDGSSLSGTITRLTILRDIRSQTLGDSPSPDERNTPLMTCSSHRILASLNILQILRCRWLASTGRRHRAVEESCTLQLRRLSKHR